MTLIEALQFEYPRRRQGSSFWDSPDEFLWYVTWDIVAEDWEIMFPNGKIVSSYDRALEYEEKTVQKGLRLVQGGKVDSGDGTGFSGPS